jgi:hypothetical protein
MFIDSLTDSISYEMLQGLPMKYTSQLEEMKKLSNYSRNYHDYRQLLRATSPPAVPFLGPSSLFSIINFPRLKPNRSISDGRNFLPRG